MAEQKNLTDTFIKWLADPAGGLSASEQRLIPQKGYDGSLNFRNAQETVNWIQGLLARGAGKPGEIYRGQLPGLVDAWVRPELREEFYYALDELNQFQMSAGWFRRSMRSKSYEPLVWESVRLLLAYARLTFYGAELSDVLTGKAAPEICRDARSGKWYYSGMLAAQLDRGDKKAARAVEEILLGENNTAMISHELIRGIVKCKDENMYRLLGDFLLAARLQEGARQAVCETMDAGRAEAFLYLFGVIEEHGLIRYSSVKRAVSTWIGIFDERNVDRITDKLLKLMGRCLRDEDFCREQLDSGDTVAISCGLWARGFYDVEQAVELTLHMAKEGSRFQMLTASYYILSLPGTWLPMKAAKEIIFRYPEDLELVACYLPGFMKRTYECFQEILKDSGGFYSSGYYSADHDKGLAPKQMLPAKMFRDEEEARTAYLTLRQILDRLPKKGVTYDPCIFPWYRVSMSRSDIAIRMCLLAWMLQDEEYMDEAAELIPSIETGRHLAARVLLYRPGSEKRKNILFELLHGGENFTMEAAFKMVEHMSLRPEDYQKIEKNMKYKRGRVQTLALLKKQEPSALRDCTARLLREKSEECRMGGLELALYLKKKKYQQEYASLSSVLEDFSDPTGKEQVLLKELVGEKTKAQDMFDTPGYGLYNPEKKWVLPPLTVDASGALELFRYEAGAYIRILENLDAWIEEHKELEYETCQEGRTALGMGLMNRRKPSGEPYTDPLDFLPFRKLWEEFYEREIKTPQMMLELYLYLIGLCPKWEEYRTNIETYREVFGQGREKKLPFEKRPEKLTWQAQANILITALFRQYVPKEMKARWGLTGTARLFQVLEPSAETYMKEAKGKPWRSKAQVFKRGIGLPVFEELFQWTECARDTAWNDYFHLRFRLLMGNRQWEDNTAWAGPTWVLEIADFVQCCVRGFWDKELFYKAVLTYYNMGALLSSVSTAARDGAVPLEYVRSREMTALFGKDKLPLTDGKYRFDVLEHTMPEVKFAREIYRELVPKVLDAELRRGEEETPASQYIPRISVAYGCKLLVRVLNALGKDKLERNLYGRLDRRGSLCRILKICYPAAGETAADLKEALKGTDIPKSRLVETAIYAPQWIPILEEYLDMPGLKSGCYYFMAHTSEWLDSRTAAMVARYTPLAREELQDGAFDVQWFFEAYEDLGEQNFQMLYDAAKYMAYGAYHTRARKYADAALGRVVYEELKTRIEEKRNKDLLMSLPLLPLSGDERKREEELLERYQYIQQFKKESRQFGAARRASESRAADMALWNLSRNAGFSDVMRLILRMETKLTGSYDQYFSWKTVDETELRVWIDDTGNSSLQCRKGEKLLKSIPAKYKKDPAVLEYQEVHKKLREQYSRARQMLEQAMEDRTVFLAQELLELSENPVIRPMLKPLVVRTVSPAEETFHMGFLGEAGLTDWSGRVHPVEPGQEVWIAHPVDFYRDGHWTEYQKLLFEKKLRQPFKQVFRELYVKLSEELDREESRMFAGYQIWPGRTIGALRGRRWVADYHDGLQKIYYKEGIAACIYAMADWFSPSDIEAPTLESVVFYDRRTGQQLKISGIPDIIYSEVMRDVDLAVSVAYAGGVDPETSHSTIELRRAVIACNLELFRVKNVRLEENHAVIDGALGRYTVHLGSGVVHQMGNAMLHILPVHSQHRGRIFLPFVDEDPKTAEIMSKILLLAEDTKIKDPGIISQIRSFS